jgi:crotonobetainyl-CoA:carnitine CoA-transferase CaiB-like acyl-CoA transferase
MGALDGIRVADLGLLVQGPQAALMLADFGADVIKVEPPAGDGTRWVEPLQRGMGTNYICLNVNKRGVVLDLKEREGREQAIQLAARADVFVQNFRGGVIERLGLGYPVLRERNPRLVYCSISGFGERGPLAREACADFIMQAFSGFARLNGAPGDALEAFRFTGFIDLTTAIMATQAVLAALVERDASGEGQKVEVSMLESALEMQATRVAEFLAGKARLASLPVWRPTVRSPPRIARSSSPSTTLPSGRGSAPRSGSPRSPPMRGSRTTRPASPTATHSPPCSNRSS